MTYSGPNLEDVQDALLNASCMAALGDGIMYQPVDGEMTPMRGYVDYADALRDIETGKIIEQDISVEVLIADVPTKPTSNCRIILGKLPGMIFKPVNVRRDSSGAHWQFEVAKVS